MTHPLTTTELPIPGFEGAPVMDTLTFVKSVAVAGPILVLLFLGILITLQSGVDCLGSGRAVRRVAGNLTHALLVLGVCLVGLAALQQLAGVRLG